ncbi:MAG: Crp/Fnr family transcriptional regulator [Shewanella sp.]
MIIKAKHDLTEKLTYFGATEHELSILLNAIQIKKLNEGDVFCATGSSKGICYLASGTMITRHNFGEGLEIISSNKTNNTFVFTSFPDFIDVSRCDYICLEDASIIYWNPSLLKQVLDSNWQLKQALLHVFMQELLFMTELGYLRPLLSKRDYIIITMILMFSVDVKNKEPSYSVGQQIMCNHVGVTRQFYSSFIHDLEHKGIIKTEYKKITLLNIAALKAELSIDISSYFTEKLKGF